VLGHLPVTRFAAAWLLAACLLLFLPGIATMPPLDHAEAATVLGTLQLLAGGDAAQGSILPGIHWFQAAMVRLLEGTGLAHRTGIGIFRLSSALAATAAVLALQALGTPLVGRRAAFLAALMLAGAAGTVVAAHLATAHAALLAATTCCMGLLALAHARPGALTAPLAAGFWGALAVAACLAGWTALLLPLLAAAWLALLDGTAWLRALRPAWGAPPLVALLVATGAEWSSLPSWPWHVALFAASCFPVAWILLLALPDIRAARRRRSSRALLAWAASAWLVLSAVQLDPLGGVPFALPPLLLLAARWACRAHPRPPPRWLNLLAHAWLIAFSAAAAAGLIGLAWLDLRVIVYGIPGALAVLALLVASLAASRKRAWPLAAMLATLLAIPAYAFTTAGTLSHLPIARAAERIAGWGRELPPGDFGVLGFSRPSLAVASGRSARIFSDATEAAGFLAQGRGRMLAVVDEEEAAFRRAAAVLRLQLRERATILCLDLTELRFMAVVFFTPGEIASGSR
jgi:hypothetical protein